MDKEIGDKLIRVLKKQTEKVIYFAQADNKSPNLSVHEIRKSFKRIRAVLQFYKMPGSAYAVSVENEILKFGKALSPLRNSFVNLSVLEKISKENSHIQESKFLFAKEVLNEKNRKLLECRGIDSELGSEICNYMQEFGVSLNTQLFVLNKAQVIQQLLNSYQKGHDTYSKENSLQNIKSLHDLRKELKMLSYQCRYLVDLNPRFFKMKVKQLTFLTEELGEDHDLAVFTKEIQHKKYNFNPSEIETIRNQIKHNHELYLVKLQPRLKQFFTVSLADFSKKLNTI